MDWRYSNYLGYDYVENKELRGKIIIEYFFEKQTWTNYNKAYKYCISRFEKIRKKILKHFDIKDYDIDTENIRIYQESVDCRRLEMCVYAELIYKNEFKDSYEANDLIEKLIDES